jgi:hypothetical protein
MKKFGFAGIIASGLAAVVLGLASPAHADYGHHQWVGVMDSSASTSHVSTSAHQ